ncbi:MAG: hypothetical protein WDW36_001290 [Sanguina aurantia]
MEHSSGADLLTLGEHCSHASCNQNDFLPFTCDCCKRTFCLEHRTYTSHSCTAAEGRSTTIIVCPLCAKAVKLPPGADVHAVFEAHTRQGGCDPANYDRVHKRPKCPAAGCKEKLGFSNTYECRACLTKVCLKHRHGGDHGCAAIQAAQKAEAAASRAARNPFAAIFRPRQQPPAAPTNTNTNTKPNTEPNTKPNSTPAARARAQQQQYADPANRVKGTTDRRNPSSIRQTEPSASSGNPQQRAAPKLSNGSSAAGASSAPQRPPPSPSQPSGSGPEECPHCRCRFTTINALIQHVEEFHTGGGDTTTTHAHRNNSNRGVDVCDLTGDGAPTDGGRSVSNPAWWAASPASQQQQQRQQQQAGRPATSSAGAASQPSGRPVYEFACPLCQRGFRDAVQLVRHSESGVCAPQAEKKQDGCVVS